MTVNTFSPGLSFELTLLSEGSPYTLSLLSQYAGARLFLRIWAWSDEIVDFLRIAKV